MGGCVSMYSSNFGQHVCLLHCISALSEQNSLWILNSWPENFQIEMLHMQGAHHRVPSATHSFQG